MNRPVTPEITSGDPGLLNGIAWSIRWQDRKRSNAYADTAYGISVDDPTDRARFNLGRAALTLAWQARWSGRFGDSLDNALIAERYLPEDRYPEERAFAYSILCTLHCQRGRFDLASHAFERGYSLTDRTCDTAAPVELLVGRASVLRNKGDSGRAGLVLGRAEEIATREESALVQYAIARWLACDGETEKALERAERAISLAGEYRCRVIEPYAHQVQAECLVALGRLEEAVAPLDAARAIASEDGDGLAEAQILHVFSKLEQARGDINSALEFSRNGAQVAIKNGFVLHRLRFTRQCAALYELRGDHKAALHEHNVAWTLADKQRN